MSRRERGEGRSCGSPGLSVVLPVYNEEEVVERVVRSWIGELERLDVDFEVLAYDDGSRDRTPQILRRLASEDGRLCFTSHPNRGHGPTLLRGYGEARGEWVFQVDSDGEMECGAFEALWQARRGYDLLVGYRQNRVASPVRRGVSSLSRLTVRAVFGKSLRDVNCPYRLMRRAWLQEMMLYLPRDTFAPNVALSGLAVGTGSRIHQQGVPHLGRRTGQDSLPWSRLLRVTWLSFAQTVGVAWRWRRLRTEPRAGTEPG